MALEVKFCVINECSCLKSKRGKIGPLLQRSEAGYMEVPKRRDRRIIIHFVSQLSGFKARTLCPVAKSYDRTMVGTKNKVPFFNANWSNKKIAFMLLSSKRRTPTGSSYPSLYNRNKSSSPAIMKLVEEAFTSYSWCMKRGRDVPI